MNNNIKFIPAPLNLYKVTIEYVTVTKNNSCGGKRKQQERYVYAHKWQDLKKTIKDWAKTQRTISNANILGIELIEENAIVV